ncbi:unnamed protein product [Rotaria socialis]|uniref:Uncharacterized protein n=1 Tax=Rotaria socialis TaxID=392032 RepID=A0A818D2X6_9BILA|nr:unnamed protein product [Rotaria socialis]CAF4665738.1 unnamed protein product [Rotaria socialis]
MILFCMILCLIPTAKVDAGNFFAIELSRAQSMFLFSDPSQNPFVDLEIDLLSKLSYSTLRDGKPQSRLLGRFGGSVNDLQETERNDQLEIQGDIDLFTFLGLLGNGPITINLLGQIMVISSKKDFSFQAHLPNGTFKYVKYPDSFKATLIQLANEAYYAFLSAHSNMNEIQLNMQQIPGHVKTALKLLITAPFPMLERLLPLSLNNIERIGFECSNLSYATHNKFADVQLLIGEINELTGNSAGITDQQLAQTIIELNKTDAAKNALKQKEAVIKEKYNEQAARVRDAQKQFEQALKDIPTGFDSIMQQVVGAVVDAYKMKVGSMQCIGGIVPNCMPGGIGSTAEAAAQNAIAKAQQAQLALQEAEARYDAIFKELMIHHDNMTQVMIRLASLDMTKIDYEQLIPIFKEAITYLSEIRKHWGRLIEFFDNIRIRVQITVKNSFTTFVDWMKTTIGMGDDYLTKEIRSMYLDMLKEDVIGIHREAHLLFIMSKTYYDVSRESMMDQLASLAKMVMASSDEERNQLKEELMQDTEMVQSKVNRVALQRKIEYEEANAQRQHEIEAFIQQATLEELAQGLGRRR